MSWTYRSTIAEVMLLILYIVKCKIIHWNISTVFTMCTSVQ